MKEYRQEPAPMDNFVSFEKLFRLYYPRLKKYAYSFLHDTGEADDLIQDVFFQFWKDRHLLNSEQNISSFIFTMLRNRCVNVLKRRIVENKYLLHQASVRSEELYHISFENDGEFVAVRELLHNELLKLTDEMPEKCGKAFRLKWMEGKKIREIAEIMNISMSMVERHLAKGLEIAKKRLNPDLFLLFLILRKN
ncbi:RNA polymerase sigma-70 factor [Gaoshiqia sp. Z1-71]|uniref:RNA polymerase sigma-70 factor n=1 Tax=Gaoshiqia hydrogeniformans TaxID=3290090 RepID=UPI003BF91837